MVYRNQKSPQAAKRNPSAKNNPAQAFGPTEVWDAVHQLLHRVDPSNHTRCQSVLSDGNFVDGFRFHVDLMDWLSEEPIGPKPASIRFLGFGEEFAQLLVLTVDGAGQLRSVYALERFGYEHPRLLQQIAAALPQVGIEIPEQLQAEIETMQRSLVQRGPSQLPAGEGDHR